MLTMHPRLHAAVAVSSSRLPQPGSSFGLRRCLATLPKPLHKPGTALYVWGSNNDKQLGTDPTSTSKILTTPRRLQLNNIADAKQDKIVGISAGASHSALVTEKGKVLTWGDKKWGVLGRDASLVVDQVPLKMDEGEIPIQVSCGSFHTAVLSSLGRVTTWGWPGAKMYGAGALGTGMRYEGESCPPTRVKVAGEHDVRLQTISSGHRHMLGLGFDGEVWSWGQGAMGLMGDGRSVDRYEPVPVSYFLELNIAIKQIACGSAFNLALSTDGVLYGWGKNDSGQLGLGGGFSMDLEPMPRQIDTLQEEIAYVATGALHTIAITTQGEVYTWGMSTWTEPHKMTKLIGQRIVAASCGHNFSVVVNDVGEVFSWGKGWRENRAGVLGHGNAANKSTKQPEKIDALRESSPSGPVCAISCGAKHVLAVTGALPT